VAGRLAAAWRPNVATRRLAWVLGALFGVQLLIGVVNVALLAQPESVVQPLLQKVGLNVTGLTQEIERELDRFPKQEGGTAEPSFSRELQRVFGDYKETPVF